MLAAISTGGVYRTDDGGDSWYPSNTGVKAEFMPGERTYPEFGQCVHKVARHPGRPDRLYLQNHGGVYRSDDGGDTWQDIAPGLPAEFGFPIVVHPHDPDTVVRLPDRRRRRPLAGRRPRPGLALDATRGESWEPLGDGALPDDYYVAVMRDAMCADDPRPTHGLYFGGRNGARLGLARRGRDLDRGRTATCPTSCAVRAAAI